MIDTTNLIPFFTSSEITAALNGFDLLDMPRSGISAETLAASVPEEEVDEVTAFARDLVQRVFLSTRDRASQQYWRSVVQHLSERENGDL